MAKKNKKNFVIDRTELNKKINEYLQNGGTITKYDCLVPEEKPRVNMEKQEVSSDNHVSLDPDYGQRIPEQA